MTYTAANVKKRTAGIYKKILQFIACILLNTQYTVQPIQNIMYTLPSITPTIRTVLYTHRGLMMGKACNISNTVVLSG